MKNYDKTVIERRRFYVDYDCWLADDGELTDFQVIINPYTEGAPLGADTSYPDATHRKLMMFVNGGKANTTYRMSLVVTTDAGQVKRDDIGMIVLP